MVFKKKDNTHTSVSEYKKYILNDKTPFAVVEAYRKLKTNLLYLPTQEKCKKFVVTSSIPGEGKTLVAINLALTLAQSGRVLLIDADMRKPRVRAALELGEGDGLSEYLSGQTSEPNIRKTNISHFYALTSGKPSNYSVELLDSETMRKFIQRAEQTFDFIVIDTPPVSVVADALALSKQNVHYICVVRSEFSKVGTTKAAIDAIKSVNGNICGLVLSSINFKKTERGDYEKGSRYGGYYSYYDGENASAENYIKKRTTNQFDKATVDTSTVNRPEQ